MDFSTSPIQRHDARFSIVRSKDSMLLNSRDRQHGALGSNAQPWEFVRDPRLQTRREIQRLYGEVWGPYKETRDHSRAHHALRRAAVKALATGDEFAAQLSVVPVHVVVFLDRPKSASSAGSADESCSTSARLTDRSFLRSK